MKQRGVGEHAIEIVIRQIELEKILLPYLAAAVGTRHCSELRGTFQTYGNVTEFGKHLEITSGPAAKIEYRERRLTLDVLQQRRDVLADVVIARTFPEIFSALIVLFQREVRDFCQVLRIQLHVRSSHAVCTAGFHKAGGNAPRCVKPV